MTTDRPLLLPLCLSTGLCNICSDGLSGTWTPPPPPRPLLPTPGAYLADSAVPARLHVVLALIAGVDKAVLALGVQLHQHAHGGPLGSLEWRELQVLVPYEGKEGHWPIHQIASEDDVRQGVGARAGNKRDHKKRQSQSDSGIRAPYGAGSTAGNS